MKFQLSKHAVQRALEMGLDADAVRRIVLHPDFTRYNPVRGTRDHVADGVKAPMVKRDDGSLIVLTFLPASEERWQREDAERPIRGRHFDPSKWGDG